MINFELKDGIVVGDVTHKSVTLREPTAKDLIAAVNEAERCVMAPIGVDQRGVTVSEPRLVASDYMIGVHTLRRQIVNVGELKGPLEIEMLYLLSAADLSLLQQKSDELDTAVNSALSEVAQRGRDHAPSSGD